MARGVAHAAGADGGGDLPAPVARSINSSIDPPDDELAARWRATYEALVHRATHEVNNALNAVAMNLEVARLRAVPGADAGRVAPFAAAAAESHDAVVALVKSLVALGRGPLDGPGDVREAAEQVTALLDPGLRAKGGALAVEVDGGGAARTAASAAAVRLAVAELLLAATLDPTANVRCIVVSGPEPALRLEPPGVVARDLATSRLLERAGVRPGPVAWSLVFPSAP